MNFSTEQILAFRSFNLLTSDRIELRIHRLEIRFAGIMPVCTHIIDFVHVEDGLGSVTDHEDEDNAGEEGGHGGVASVGVAAGHRHHVPTKIDHLKACACGCLQTCLW